MNKKEKLALFLGMLSGDGCLSIKYNGEGYRDYPVYFCNTNKKLVEKFRKLFFDIFGVYGKIYSEKKENKQRLWYFNKHSTYVYGELIELGFPQGVKRDKLRILPIVKNRNNKEKRYFIQGLLLTDGSIKKNGSLMFHMGSKLFLKDLSALINEMIGVKRPVKEFVQRDKFKSYQLTLNKANKDRLLSPRATMVLERS